MNKKEFKDFINNRCVLLDGGSGTLMSESGMPDNVCPEYWACLNPDIIKNIHTGYIDAGSDIIYTFTLGANGAKLKNFDMAHNMEFINSTMAMAAKEAAAGKVLVAGDIGPTGIGIKPLGALTFEDAVDIYKKQVSVLLNNDVDLFVIETMIDIQEARAALIAVKEACSLPVMVTMAFEKNNRTISGTSPAAAIITLQSLGADAVGANCGYGPDTVEAIINEMIGVARVPVIVKPNAGIPKLINGKTVFEMKADEFSTHCNKLINSGVSIIGGCCGTDFSHIQKLGTILPHKKPKFSNDSRVCLLSSATDAFIYGFNDTVNIIGERINPTGKKQLQQELTNGIYDNLLKSAYDQQKAGAAILDVNVAVPGTDEKKIMCDIVERLSGTVNIPLCLDSADAEVFERSLRIYPGRALVNSVSLDKEKSDKVFSVAKKYGAMVILLPLNGTSMPKNNDEKHYILKELYAEAQKYGLSENDIIVDALTMSVASDPGAAYNVLETIEFCKNDLGLFTLSGLSNISFGMPERQFINGAMMTLCIQKGLNFAISDPLNDVVMNSILSANLLLNRDDNGLKYIENIRRDVLMSSGVKAGKIHVDKEHEQSNNKDTQRITETLKDYENNPIYKCVLKGLYGSVGDEIDKGLDSGIKAEDMQNKILIPAIEKVGSLYEKGVYYLPQLIASSNAFKKSFEKLKPFLKKENYIQEKPICIMATVKGDIHDIGKNIVCLMLENNGIMPVDLGKDVNARNIIDAAVTNNAKLIGLSALMTVTMRNMEEVIELKNQICPDVKVMVGGACVTEEYAKAIGADGYGENAADAVKTAKRLLGL